MSSSMLHLKYAYVVPIVNCLPYPYVGAPLQKMGNLFFFSLLPPLFLIHWSDNGDRWIIVYTYAKSPAWTTKGDIKSFHKCAVVHIVFASLAIWIAYSLLLCQFSYHSILYLSLYNARVSYFNMVCAQRRINGCCLSWVRSSQAIFYGRPNPVPLLQQCQTLFHFNTHHGKEKGSRFSRRFSKEQE